MDDVFPERTSSPILLHGSLGGNVADHYHPLEVGGERVYKDRAPQPGGQFVSSVRARAHCYSCRVRDERVDSISLYDFGSESISLFPSGLASLSYLREWEYILVNLNEWLRGWLKGSE